MWPLVRCLSARIGIRNRGVAVVRCSGATVVILRVGFRPLPKSAHLTVYGDAHVRLASSERISRVSHRSDAVLTAALGALCLIHILLEGLIGHECHDHQDNKNRYHKGWNKPGDVMAVASPLRILPWFRLGQFYGASPPSKARPSASLSRAAPASNERPYVRTRIVLDGGECRASLSSPAETRHKR
jgi:hypothetical protein